MFYALRLLSKRAARPEACMKICKYEYLNFLKSLPRFVALFNWSLYDTSVRRDCREKSKFLDREVLANSGCPDQTAP